MKEKTPFANGVKDRRHLRVNRYKAHEGPLQSVPNPGNVKGPRRPPRGWTRSRAGREGRRKRVRACLGAEPQSYVNTKAKDNQGPLERSKTGGLADRHWISDDATAARTVLAPGDGRGLSGYTAQRQPQSPGGTRGLGGSVS